jgi:integrase/recombinase XerD
MIKKLKIQLENNKTFKQGFEEFINSCESRNLRLATIEHYEEGYKAIIKFLHEDTAIKDISAKTVGEFVRYCRDNLNINSQTLHTYCRDFKTILYFFMRMDYMNTFKISLPKVDKTAIESYSDAELKILLKKPDLKKCTFVEYRNYVIVNFLISTAVRLNSLINIKIKDIDLENEVVHVNVTKNRKPLILPLNRTIMKILKEYLKIRQYKSNEEYLFCTAYNKQLCKKTLNGSLNKYNHDRGIVKTGIHRYRHTSAKKFILAGKNPAILQKLLGHSSLLITQNYINILVSDLKKEINDYDILEEFNSTNHIKMKYKNKRW